MKLLSQLLLFPALAAMLALSVTSCQKAGTENDSNTEELAIAVAVSESPSGISGTSGDSVFIMHELTKKDKREAVATASLAAAIKTYLSENYPGYKFHKAIAVKHKDETKGYVLIIFFNDKPVALRFDAAGVFVKVLEQREKGGIRGKGWHHGGRFQARGGIIKDTIALSAIPTELLAIFRAAHGTDTLLKAFRAHDNSILLISKNKSLFATVFTTRGALVSRARLHQREGSITEIETAALLPAITTYLQTTYPGYVVNKAFSIAVNNTLQGYVVLINANNTRYSILFNANGRCEAAKVIR